MNNHRDYHLRTAWGLLESTLPRSGTVVFCLAMGVALWAQTAQKGAKVADFRLADSTGRVHSLQSYSGKIVVLVFWSFKCPVALAYDDRLNDLQAKYGSKDVVILGVSSSGNETPEEVQRNASNLRLSFPVLLDPDGTLAESLGATHSPSVFILDQGGRLSYQGSLDNNRKPGDGARIPYAEDAIEQLLSGATVTTPETKVFGCSLKRR